MRKLILSLFVMIVSLNSYAQGEVLAVEVLSPLDVINVEAGTLATVSNVERIHIRVTLDTRHLNAAQSDTTSMPRLEVTAWTRSELTPTLVRHSLVSHTTRAHLVSAVLMIELPLGAEERHEAVTSYVDRLIEQAPDNQRLNATRQREQMIAALEMRFLQNVVGDFVIHVELCDEKIPHQTSGECQVRVVERGSFVDRLSESTAGRAE